jgi:pentatricopeptide repeat protein
MEFLPGHDPRVERTIDLTLERLTDRGLVYRYLTDDGLPGSEGAFGLCTYWMVDALALRGRLDEAWDLFDGMKGRANHLGLYAEEIDPHSGEFLGNYPQAFTHIGLINSVLYLARAEGRRPRAASEPIGSRTETPAAGVRATSR